LSTEWKQIDVPTEVLLYLQRRNRAHFGQAQGTPFTVQPLIDVLGYRGDRDASHQILNGTYDTTQLNQNVALLVKHLKQTEAMAALETKSTITEAENVTKLAVWKESTTTSPSGLHLDHYIALTARHKYSTVDNDGPEETAESEKQTEWNHMQTCMLKLHVHMLNYALERDIRITDGKQ
jgi:hypothetical protein